MIAFFQKIAAFFLSILALLGIGKGPASPEEPAPDAEIASCVLYKNEVDFTFESNASTGFAWEVVQEGDAVRKTRDTYAYENVGNMAGAPGEQQYTFSAVRPGRVTITFTYRRSWEDVPPLYTYVAELTVDDALNIAVESFEAI